MQIVGYINTNKDHLHGQKMKLHSYFNFEWVVDAIFRRPFTPGKTAATHCTGGWVGPKSGAQNIATYRDSIPGPPSP